MAETLRLGEYLLGIEGLAMIRSLTRPSQARSRIEEMHRILAELPGAAEIPLTEYAVSEGYARWAGRYDGPNPAIAAEQPVVHAILDRLTPGRALDAACGTGRHAARLLELGHQVVGVDTSPEMLALARKKLPGADLRRGRLEQLPVQDASVDLVTCALALTHVTDLEPVLREFARVLRPGGSAVISDIHPMATMTGAIAAFPGPDLTQGLPYVTSLVHQVGEYLAGFRAAGLAVLECLEPAVDETMVPAMAGYDAVPGAVRQAFLGMPFLLVWRLEKP